MGLPSTSRASTGRPSVSNEAVRTRMVALLQAATVEVYERNAPGVLGTQFRSGTDVYVSYLPGDDVGRRIEIATILREAGYNPVLHVPARQMLSRDFLDDYLGRAVNSARVDRVLAIAGDSTRARGPYSTSLDVIASGALQQAGIRTVDFAGHPEGNVGIPERELVSVLRAKGEAAASIGMASAVVTQFSFDPRPIERWLHLVHDAGLRMPVRIGLAGPANPATLMKFALRCGIGNSVSALQKHVGTIGRLLKDTGPDGVVRGLGDVLTSEPGRSVECFHFFPFGGLAKTSAWIEAAVGEWSA